MRIKWLNKALANLDNEAAYIARENPIAAKRVVQLIVATVNLLTENPAMGHPGRLHGTRELVIPGTKYIVPYRVTQRGQQIEILRVFHSARKLPEHW